MRIKEAVFDMGTRSLRLHLWLARHQRSHTLSIGEKKKKAISFFRSPASFGNLREQFYGPSPAINKVILAKSAPSQKFNNSLIPPPLLILVKCWLWWKIHF